MKRKDFAAAI